jgi:hypothetical protein
MPSVTTVPGRWPLIGHTVTLLRSPVEFLSSLPARGDVVRVFLGPLPVHLVTTPEFALQLLTSDSAPRRSPEMRRAREDVEIGGVLVPKRSEIAVSQHTPHRDPRWFPNPGQFDPDRREPARTAALPKGAFIPFGAGSPFLPRTSPSPHGDRGRDDRDPAGPRPRCGTTCLRPGEGDHAAQQAAHDRHE